MTRQECLWKCALSVFFCCFFTSKDRLALHKSLSSCLQVHTLGSNLPKTEAAAEMLIIADSYIKSQMLPVEFGGEKTVRKRRDISKIHRESGTLAKEEEVEMFGPRRVAGKD